MPLFPPLALLEALRLVTTCRKISPISSLPYPPEKVLLVRYDLLSTWRKIAQVGLDSCFIDVGHLGWSYISQSRT